MSEPRKIPAISTVMTEAPHTIRFDQTVLEAEQLMKIHSIRHLPVVQGERFVGVISDRDLRVAREIEKSTKYTMEVGEVCTKDAYIVSPATGIDEVATSMAEEGIGSAIVVDKGNVVGIFTSVDACRCYGELLRLQHTQAISEALHS